MNIKILVFGNQKILFDEIKSLSLFKFVVLKISKGILYIKKEQNVNLSKERLATIHIFF
jgi:hypothetical protein